MPRGTGFCGQPEAPGEDASVAPLSVTGWSALTVEQVPREPRTGKAGFCRDQFVGPD